MKLKSLETEEDYNIACKRVYFLMHTTEEAIEPESPEGEELEYLSALIEKYEQVNHQL
ncbi:MAG: hypothetical protein R3182_14435 [Draconibacterium sp.]|nr:hypothetical protein [Draconibacterium sp.]